MVGSLPSARDGAGVRRRPFARAALAGLALALAVGAACGGDGDGGDESASPTLVPHASEYIVTAFEWGFSPERIPLRLGEARRIELVNTGDVLHNLKIDEALPAEDVQSESSGPLAGGQGDLFVGTAAGGNGALVFTPLETGTFVFYCTIEGHRGLGMEGAVVVE
ncbi:MAG: cupredoxin domain-containing protein [Dehalococcoidia bacterium]|nr:cupredoxin domain-containing protein [Dehalococcoidia bacterium]MDZ4277963.1 cupredoxin domain-containing protein [Dehalococcoidia bacterium]